MAVRGRDSHAWAYTALLGHQGESWPAGHLLIVTWSELTVQATDPANHA